MEQYAYIRVSTKEQNIDRQMLALGPYEIKKKNIYCDYQSGKDFDRPAYMELLQKLKAGDLLIIKSIDRLGRDYRDILVQWQRITKEVQADILVLDMDLLDTRTKADNLTGTLIADLVLQIFAYVAQTEREFIRQRQAEGIAAAKEKGVRFGRPEKDLPKDFPQYIKAWELKTMEHEMILEECGMSRATFYRRMKSWREREIERERQCTVL